MFCYNVISHNSSYYFKMYISEITKKEKVEKEEPLYTVGGNANWHGHYGKQYGGSSRN